MLLLNNQDGCIKFRFGSFLGLIYNVSLERRSARNISTNIQFIRRFDISINDSLNSNYSIYDKHD